MYVLEVNRVQEAQLRDPGGSTQGPQGFVFLSNHLTPDFSDPAFSKS